MRDVIHLWLTRFSLEPALHAQALEVFIRLPDPVRSDLMDDPTFTLTHAQRESDGSVTVLVASPSKNKRVRCVVLRRSLATRGTPFMSYIIAHELAHAFLNNEGRWPGEDPEHAADALAAAWGFPKP